MRLFRAVRKVYRYYKDPRRRRRVKLENAVEKLRRREEVNGFHIWLALRTLKKYNYSGDPELFAGILRAEYWSPSKKIAIELIGENGDERHLQLLRKYIRAVDSGVVVAAMRAISKIDPKETAHLIIGLSIKNPFVYWTATDLLVATDDWVTLILRVMDFDDLRIKEDDLFEDYEKEAPIFSYEIERMKKIAGILINKILPKSIEKMSYGKLAEIQDSEWFQKLVDHRQDSKKVELYHNIIEAIGKRIMELALEEAA